MIIISTKNFLNPFTYDYHGRNQVRPGLDNHALNKLSENFLWMIILYSRYNDRNVDE